jgi:fructose-bisphosphate aldolase class I
MRSVIKQASTAGIDAIVNQQFEFAAPIIAAGLVPIVEPEVDIHCPEKSRAETLLKAAIQKKLAQLPAGQLVMLKLTLPEQDNFYSEFVGHPKVVRVVALSGGYTRGEANDRLRRNHGVVRVFRGRLSKAVGSAIRCRIQRGPR